MLGLNAFALAGDTGRLLIYILLDAVPVRQVLPEAL